MYQVISDLQDHKDDYGSRKNKIDARLKNVLKVSKKEPSATTKIKEFNLILDNNNCIKCRRGKLC